MAEWTEVTNQFNRMCLYYRRKHERPMGCPMNGVNISQCRNVTFDRPKETEEIVTQWAAEHPEPVYSTWAEYLNSIGVIISDRPFPAPNIPVYVYQAGAKMFEPISADIAQKLGLQPKEV